MNAIKIVVAQINLMLGDLEGNAKRIIEESQKAIKQHQADVVVFPEMALSGYPPEDLLLRPHFYQRCHAALHLIETAKLPIHIVLGYPDKIGMHNYNRATAIFNGEKIGSYSKQELPNYTVFDEKRYFSAGNAPCVFDCKGIKLGIVICEDLWFQGPTQQSVEAGAQVIIGLNASPFDRNKDFAREHMLIERTKESNVPIIYANLIGGQDELVFDGGSMVVDSDGKRIQQAAYFTEDHMLVTIENNSEIKIKPQALPPRLTTEEKLYKALTLGIRDYIQKNKFPGAIIGLSGGIDSALTLAIAVDAIGADKVRGVAMPSRFTADMSNEDAKIQAETMGIQFDVIPIEPMFDAFLNSLFDAFKNTKPNSAEENIQARIRGIILMALSNKFGSIVLTTGNKTEMSIGYATLYGDMAGGFAAIKDIPKMWVYRLAEYRNTISPVIPKRVIERAPSAELAEGQLDQDTLPSYEILDEILKAYIEEDKDPASIYSERCDKATVDRVVKMIHQNEYKRRQAPVGIRTTERAFGKDRRYPITSGY